MVMYVLHAKVHGNLLHFISICAVSMTVLSVRNSSQLHRANISDLKLSKAHTHECKFTYMGAYWQAVKKGKTNNKHITKQMNTLNGSHGTWYTCICIYLFICLPVVPHKAVAEVSKIGNL